MSNSETLKIEFLRGFTWAVPTAFSNAIAQCQFEEGDIFYDSKEAYQKWGSSLNVINKIIQVQSIPKMQSEVIEDESSGIFKKNWHSFINISVLSNNSQHEQKLTTSQGRLFTFLVTGNQEILDLNLKEPEIPVLWKDAKSFFDERILDSFKKIIFNQMEKPNIFIMLYDVTNNTAVSKFREVYDSLSDIFKTKIFELSPKECVMSKHDRLFPTITLKCVAIDSGKSEAIRDIIKKVLWPKKDYQKAKPVSYILGKDSNFPVRPFRLSSRGVFSSFKSVKNKAKGIKTHSFSRNSHFIRYRVSLDKLALSPKKLQPYLERQFTDCPNHLFIDSDFSASKVKAEFEVELKHSDNHELISFARDSRDFTEVKSRHENLEKYLLNHDNQSIACEVPVWIESGEFKDYHEVFKTTQNLTGHIDLLRYNANGKIEIWDYKPGAFKEKKAKSQVFLYAFMLATRSGISLNNILCGYFDEIDAFYFEPSEIKSFEIT